MKKAISVDDIIWLDVKVLRYKEISIITFLTSLFVLLSRPQDLQFVDVARYAHIARNFLEGGGFTTSFIFSSVSTPSSFGWPAGLPPIHILSIVAFFKLFGVGDTSVILASSFFYLISIPLVFLIGNKLFGKKVGLFSSLFYVFTPQLQNYAWDGASESIFIFELLLISYLIIVNKRWSLLLSGIVVGVSIFTKLQSFLFAPIFLIWVYLLNRNSFKNMAIFIVGPTLMITLNKIGVLFSDYQLSIPTYLALQQSSLFPGDNLPRSGIVSEVDYVFLLKNIKIFFSKFIYNLYNFYKIIFTFDNLLPPWASPVVVMGYLFSNILFFIEAKRGVWLFRFITLLMVFGSFVLAAATSPHIRYAHFVLPLVIILAVDFIVQIFKKLNFSTRQESYFLVSFLFVFMVVPFVGNFTLDSRFNTKQYNTDKPHAQQLLGQKIGALTTKDAIVVTNLDTWGSWYGNRRTILMPLNFKVLENIDKVAKVDSIFLTDFQRDNQDHPLNEEWGVMYDRPQEIIDSYIINNFSLVKEGNVSAQEVYENKQYNFKLWVRK